MERPQSSGSYASSQDRSSIKSATPQSSIHVALGSPAEESPPPISERSQRVRRPPKHLLSPTWAAPSAAKAATKPRRRVTPKKVEPKKNNNSKKDTMATTATTENVEQKENNSKKTMRTKREENDDDNYPEWVWTDPEFLISNPKSPFADVNLRTLFALPNAWDCLTAEEQAELLALLPPGDVLEDDGEHKKETNTNGNIAAKPQARPNMEKLLNDDNFRRTCARYVEDLRDGRFEKEWLVDAQRAAARRAKGDFEKFEIEKFESEWGEDAPLEYKPAPLPVSGEAAGQAACEAAGEAAGDTAGVVGGKAGDNAEQQKAEPIGSEGKEDAKKHVTNGEIQEKDTETKHVVKVGVESSGDQCVDAKEA